MEKEYLVQVEYQRRPTTKKPAGLIIAASYVFLIAFLLYVGGEIRVGCLDWTGYDPDPDIAQSLMNDARIARTILPFCAAALIANTISLFLAAGCFIKEQFRWLALTLTILSLLAELWYGYRLLIIAFFAS